MTINIFGLKINYRRSGSGTPVLFLHGWGSSMDAFRAAFDSLSESHEVMALDLPGFGGSDSPHTPWSVDDYTNLVIEFIKVMGVSRLSCIGHSFGGRVIIKLANRRDVDFTLNKLVLVDSAGIKPAKTLRTRIRQRTYKLLRGFLSLKPMVRLFPNALDKLRGHFGSSDYKNASPILRQTLVNVVNEDLTGLLPTIDRPTLLVWGDADTATPISDAHLMEKLIPDAGLVTIKGAGHFSFIEQPYLFDKVLHSFLDE